MLVECSNDANRIYSDAMKIFRIAKQKTRDVEGFCFKRVSVRRRACRFENIFAVFHDKRLTVLRQARMKIERIAEFFYGMFKLSILRATTEKRKK